MKEMKELPYTRQKRILERLNKNDCMTINELAKDFNVSQMTIYRDILQLEIRLCTAGIWRRKGRG